MNVEERFWSKVHMTEKCWLWTAAQNGAGYGSFSIGTRATRRLVLAHRWTYEALVGPIPSGLVLDHVCRNRACVRPSHLEPVTPRENVRRGDALKSHCPSGHPYDDDNTRWYRGKRRCRACQQLHDAGRPRHGRRAPITHRSA